MRSIAFEFLIERSCLEKMLLERFNSNTVFQDPLSKLVDISSKVLVDMAELIVIMDDFEVDALQGDQRAGQAEEHDAQNVFH